MASQLADILALGVNSGSPSCADVELLVAVSVTEAVHMTGLLALCKTPNRED